MKNLINHVLESCVDEDLPVSIWPLNVTTEENFRGTLSLVSNGLYRLNGTKVVTFTAANVRTINLRKDSISIFPLSVS